MNAKMINRVCLKFAADVVGIPQALSDFQDHLCNRGLDHSGAARAVAYLTSAGYLEMCGTAASQMWKCTAKGARQAAREVKPDELDPMIWE